MTELEGYVKGGIAPLHYGSIKYLPCYAAAGSQVTLGLFNDVGKVSFESIIFAKAKCLWDAIPVTCISASCQLQLLEDTTSVVKSFHRRDDALIGILTQAFRPGAMHTPPDISSNNVSGDMDAAPI